MPAPIIAAGVAAASNPKVQSAVKTGIKTVSGLIKGKTTDAVLIRNRDKIFDMFKTAGFGPGNPGFEKAVNDNGMTHSKIPNQKVNGDYSEEWRRLWQMVVDTFVNIGRKDLADNFAVTVPVYTTTVHPVDYIATLLKGAGSKPSVQAAESKYAVLLPFKGIMTDALTSKGVAAPSNLEDLIQVFYNNFIAGKMADYDAINFDTLEASHAYHLDEALVEAVITYVKNLADRKASGEVLPKTLDKIATGTQQVQEKLEKAAVTEVKKEIGDVIMENWKWILAVIVALIIIVIFLAKK